MAAPEGAHSFEDDSGLGCFDFRFTLAWEICGFDGRMFIGRIRRKSMGTQ
jgi:hypothetical protein